MQEFEIHALSFDNKNIDTETILMKTFDSSKV